MVVWSRNMLRAIVLECLGPLCRGRRPGPGPALAGVFYMWNVFFGGYSVPSGGVNRQAAW
jgi:hypothetical protein